MFYMSIIPFTYSIVYFPREIMDSEKALLIESRAMRVFMLKTWYSM